MDMSSIILQAVDVQGASVAVIYIALAVAVVTALVIGIVKAVNVFLIATAQADYVDTITSFYRLQKEVKEQQVLAKVEEAALAKAGQTGS